MIPAKSGPAKNGPAKSDQQKVVQQNPELSALLEITAEILAENLLSN
ncbi:MAG: hypothetical protein PHF18_06595 [Methanosarcina sp.]|nr:hypothetical protein [Methanosarcina sp.]MDD3246506.1 hypothetical protein [Methanosarcina sp.]